MRIFFIFVAFFLTSFVVQGEVGLVEREWMESYLLPEDKLLCIEENESGVYFAANSNGKVKVGRLVDVDDRLGYPMTIISSLAFRDQNNEPIGTKDEPETIKSEYVEIEGEYFSESVKNYYVYRDTLKVIEIIFSLKKYKDSEYIPTKQDLKDSDLVEVFVCKSAWN